MTNIFDRIFLVMCGVALVAGAGCSSSTTADGGDSGASGDVAANSDAAPFGLTLGTWCYKILAASNVTDGCTIGVGAPALADGLVGTDLPVTYTLSGQMGTLSVGNDGSLGQGLLLDNTGTLLRENDPTLDSMMTCSHHQTDTSVITLTATNAFTLDGTEVQSMFAAACSAVNIPAGGACTSTWSWTMAIDAAGDAAVGCD